MKQKLLFFIASLTLMVPAGAQGIYEANLATENSIVRVLPDSDRDVVIYNEVAQGVGGFLLYTVGSTTAQHIDLPDGISVKDFEIMGEEVWFCGEKADATLPTGRCGVVGTFNIPNTFSGSDVVNYTEVGNMPYGSGASVFVTSLARLDLFQIQQSGIVAMAMTGESYIYDDTSMKRSTVVSASLIPILSSPWHICALFNKGNTAVFTDIAALDNVVTAVGTDKDGTKLKAKSFYNYLDFPNSPILPSYGDSIVCHDPIGKALIAHTVDDEAVVAQLDEKSYTTVHLFDFASGSALPTAPTRLTDDPGSLYGTPWDIQEVRYNTASDTINVLEYGMLPGGNLFETLLWTFPRTTAWPLVPVQPMTIVTQASMDVAIDGRPVTVGEVISSGLLDIHSFIPGTIVHKPDGSSTIVAPEELLLEPDACTEYDEISDSEEVPIIHQIFINDCGPIATFNNNPYNPEITEIKFNPICE